MSNQPFSPTKLHIPKEDYSYKASVVLEAQTLYVNKTLNKLLICPNENLPFNNVNILDPSINSNTNDDDIVTTYILKNTNQWKPSADEDEMKKTLSSLRQAICKHPTSNNNVLFANGSKYWDKKLKLKKYMFRCIKSRASQYKPINDDQIKLSSTNNTRKYDSMPKGNIDKRRRTQTIRPIEKVHVCPFFFYVFANQYCFFIQVRNEILHKYHSMEDVSLKRIKLDKHDEEKRLIMSRATKRASSVAMGMSSLCNIPLSRQTVVYNLQKKDSFICNGQEDECIQITTNTAEGVRDILMSFGCKVMILRSKNNDVTSEIDLKESDLTMTTDYNDNDDIESWFNNVSVKRSSNNNEHKNLICIAWLNQQQLQVATSFFLNLHIDATHKVCKISNLQLLTLSTKDNLGYTIVFLRMWVPNQKEWMFRFVFHHVIPKMIGSQYCRQVKAIISDGDIHLTKVIDSAIATTYQP